MRNPTGQPGSGTPTSVASSTNLQRRRFLLSAGSASVAAAAVSAVPAATAAVAAPQPEAQSATASGYRETEHVRQYYRTAKL